MRSLILRWIVVFIGSVHLVAVCRGQEEFPLVDEAFEARLFAKDPLVRNPCAITFDRFGRLFVGMGPQYRRPTPETPGDSVWILNDLDRDGRAESRTEFARGLNAIQGLVWQGEFLWIANAPDLTRVRDLDGDDVADEYVRVYTDLGNLEHGLHGLRVGPDGKLYMSKGNSKGHTRDGHPYAPQPFRELWGVEAPDSVPEFPEPRRFTRETYEKTYHDPSDDWGLMGGILRADLDGSNLEIVSRGYRNPWDIAYDDGFDWLGTDNDQTLGDKIFNPFYGAHFGWGHPWSHDWLGDDHLPSAPSAGPLFEGSGTGVVFVGVDNYPEPFRDVFLINDWLRREVLVYRPAWRGAWMRPDQERLAVLASAGAGRSMNESSGRAFDPVDIEVGLDGGIYISSWGRQYGAAVDDGQMVNEGRIYRLFPKEASPHAIQDPVDPWRELDSPFEIRRVWAQEELVRVGSEALPRLRSILETTNRSKRLETWALWTIARIDPSDPSIERSLDRGSENLQIQSLRIQGSRGDLSGSVAEALESSNPRIRHAAVLAIHEARASEFTDALISLAERESDRVVYYSLWKALIDLVPETRLRSLLDSPAPRVRLAAVLGLLEHDALSEPRLRELVMDSQPDIQRLARRRLGGRDETEIRGAALSRTSDDLGQDAKIAVEPTMDDAGLISVATKIRSVTGRAYEQAVLQVAARAYTDRPYRITSVPESLRGSVFIRTANDDADLTEGAGFEMEALFDSTLYLADDPRGNGLPTWARGKFEPTELVIETEDGSRRLYRRMASRGLVRFGANRDGIDARKGGYLVVVEPQFLNPDAEPATRSKTLDALSDARVERGRSLFMSARAANCVGCHRMEDRGNAYAPDLSEIGSRAGPEFLIESILNPSSAITEGFTAQTFILEDGAVATGLVLSETGAAVEIVSPGPVKTTLAKDRIVSRSSEDQSAMPSTYGLLLRDDQVADIVAYLMTKKRAATSLESNTSSQKAPNKTFEILDAENGFALAYGGQRLFEFSLGGPDIWRPFMTNLSTLAGVPITRPFPPVEGQDPTDHAFMHPGVSFGYANINGENFWHNRSGRIVAKWLERPKLDGNDSVRYAIDNQYISATGESICEERRDYRIALSETGYRIDIRCEFSGAEPIKFGVKEEMGLAIRVASPLRVRGGAGRILNGAGGLNESGTWGEVDRWWDYSAHDGSARRGIMVISHDRNPPVWSHSRDYGLLVANPFPVDAPANRGTLTVVPPETTLELGFSVLVYDAPVEELLNLEAISHKARENWRFP